MGHKYSQEDVKVEAELVLRWFDESGEIKDDFPP